MRLRGFEDVDGAVSEEVVASAEVVQAVSAEAVNATAAEVIEGNHCRHLEPSPNVKTLENRYAELEAINLSN